MCGIAGIISLSGKPLSSEATDSLGEMLSCMFHRGPDGTGHKQFNDLLFGMQRLSIIDIGGGQQPISNDGDSIWIIMNGEIYNYVELREILVKKGHRFKTHSDTEVALRLYEEYGEEFIQQLNGMFAICIYDIRKDQVLIFRDRMGIKPLFYAEHNGHLYFSSEMNGLSRVINAGYSTQSIASYLYLSYIPKPVTAYDRILKLLPGQAIKIDRKRNLKFYFYWTLHRPINDGMTAPEAMSQLEKLLLEANEIQLRTDTDFAISLSGGIDSTTVLAFASESYKKQLNTISIGYEGKDDSQDNIFSRQMAAQFNTNHTEVTVQRERFMDYLHELMPFMDEPISDSACIPTYIVAKEARARGIKVLLSGAGGDELFGGYHRHWRSSYLSARGLVLYPALFRKLGFLALAAVSIDNNNQRLLNPKLAFASDINGLNYSFLKQVSKPEVYELQMQVVNAHYSSVNFEKDGYEYNKMYHDAGNYLVDNILSLNDKASMAASVEGRFPLIDHRIVELAFSMPEEINLYEGRPKGLLKKVIAPYVPASVINRKKEGFNAPIDSWFSRLDNKKVTTDILNGVEEYLSGFLDLDKLHRAMSVKNKDSKYFENLYNLFLLVEWFKSRNSNG